PSFFPVPGCGGSVPASCARAVTVVRASPYGGAWDSGDLELFDLVEEIQQNFYEFLGVEQDASSADIRKAYRKLSLTLHPDKNKEENAETDFRQLVSIYEVLKDEERRQRYNDILVNGLPDWRQPVFYYRRVRKMSNAELALLLFIIFTVGHYAVLWSIYLEKQLDELLSKKKRDKKKKAGVKMSDEIRSGLLEKNERVCEKPQWQDLLPFKIGILFYFSVRSLPQLYQDARQYYVEYNEKKRKENEEAKALAELEMIHKEKKIKIKKPKSEFPVYSAITSNIAMPSYDQGISIEEIEEQMDDWLESGNRQQKKTPEWAEEEISQLTRSMVKFPGGTPGRWEKIAHELGRSVSDVTTKAKQVKEAVSHPSGTIRFSDLKYSAKGSVNLSDSIITQREEDENEIEEQDLSTCQTEATSGARRRKTTKPAGVLTSAVEEVEEKVRNRRQKDFDVEQETEDLVDSDSDMRKKEQNRNLEELWTQNQQKLLELALQQYPKGTSERWDKIAKCVPGKSKEDCICRYKLLVELVQKKKQARS
ncbi:hypothetical protein GDO86_011882, partial [Hymenochirus boettgeri]